MALKAGVWPAVRSHSQSGGVSAPGRTEPSAPAAVGARGAAGTSEPTVTSQGGPTYTPHRAGLGGSPALGLSFPSERFIFASSKPLVHCFCASRLTPLRN